MGARALSMAGAYSAMGEDATSSFWNPAGLVGLEGRYNVEMMHGLRMSGLGQHSFIGFVTAIDTSSQMSVSIQRMGIDDVPDTRNIYNGSSLDFSQINEFSASDYSFAVSYARKLSPYWSIGGSVKALYRNAGNFVSAWGIGADVGLRYSKKKWKGAFVLKDVTGTYSVWNVNSSLIEDVYTQTGNVIPSRSTQAVWPMVVLGLGRREQLGQFVGLSYEADLALNFGGQQNALLSNDAMSLSPTVGVEMDYAEHFFARFGLGGFQEVSGLEGSSSLLIQPGFGVGVKYGKFRFDYALTSLGGNRGEPPSNIFSLALNFE